MEDPGFPRDDGENPKDGVLTYFLAIFSRKLYEIEKKFDQEEGASRFNLPMMLLCTYFFIRCKDFRSFRTEWKLLEGSLLPANEVWGKVMFYTCLSSILSRRVPSLVEDAVLGRGLPSGKGGGAVLSRGVPFLAVGAIMAFWCGLLL